VCCMKSNMGNTVMTDEEIALKAIEYVNGINTSTFRHTLGSYEVRLICMYLEQGLQGGHNIGTSEPTSMLAVGYALCLKDLQK
jgi:hypothetical protein